MKGARREKRYLTGTINMPRKHKMNPKITVLMQTIGANQDKIAKAIKSCFDQKYTNWRLVIMNTHPQPLKIKNLQPKFDVEIHNIEDIFTRSSMQCFHIVSLCETDCWTVIDDDDWIEPDHLSQLVGYWNQCSDRTNAPLQICTKNVTAHYSPRVGEGEKVLFFKGWHQSLFERLTKDEIDYCTKLFPKDQYNGGDTWLASNTYFDRRDFDGKPTYHWDRTGGNHVSNYETIDTKTPEGKFKAAMNYWRIKMEARLSTLREVEI